MAAGTTIRILVGKLKGKLGEIVSIQGGVYTVRHAQGTTTFRARELEAV
jgi:hypothetical protein